jgi:glucokinase
MTIIAADIGGTHARFALVENDALANPEKLLTGNFRSLETALADYGARHNIALPCTLLIACAATSGDQNVWRFLNRNSWVIDRRELERAGWSVPLIVNDFMASAHGALILPESGLIALKPGAEKQVFPRVILGPGTGLGMAYMVPLPAGGWHVQGTAGGHMLAAALTDEQREILALTREKRGGDTIAIPEDVVSGRGLPALYRAVCQRDGLSLKYETVDALLAHPEDEAVAGTLRLFHEFLGLFAHNVVVTTHAFGGLYLDGGMLNALRGKNLFDFKTVEKFFLLDVAPSVRERLADTPVWLVNDPFVALRGLVSLSRIEF